MDIYVSTYLASSALIMLAIERFMRVFFDKRHASLSVTVALYSVYIFSTSLSFLLIGIPLVNMIVSFVAIFVVTLCYRTTIVKRLAATTSIYLLIALVDAVVFLSFDIPFYSLLDEVVHRNIFLFIANGLVFFFVALLVQNFKNIRKNHIVSPMYWLCAFVMPLSSIFIALLLLSATGLSQMVLIIAILAIFVINILTFYMHDRLSSVYAEKLKLVLASKEKEHYQTQYQLIRESAEGLMFFKHDIKNHLAVIGDHAKKGRLDNVATYLEKLLGDLEMNETYSKTGNIAFDSVINYKLKNARENKIDVTMNAAIPTELNVEEIHVVAILGNLLDNALAAVELVQDKQIKLSLEYSKGGLYMKAENTFNGRVLYEGDEIISSTGEDGRGKGLKNIRKAVDRYNGHMEVKHDESKFFVGILMHVSPD